MSASSNPGDVVLDPFCGSGTTVHAAEKLGRQWIGIDITHLSISLIEKRLKDAFPEIKFTVHGTPKDHKQKTRSVICLMRGQTGHEAGFFEDRRKRANNDP